MLLLRSRRNNSPRSDGFTVGITITIRRVDRVSLAEIKAMATRDINVVKRIFRAIVTSGDIRSDVIPIDRYQPDVPDFTITSFDLNLCSLIIDSSRVKSSIRPSYSIL